MGKNTFHLKVEYKFDPSKLTCYALIKCSAAPPWGSTNIFVLPSIFTGVLYQSDEIYTSRYENWSDVEKEVNELLERARARIHKMAALHAATPVDREVILHK